MLSRLARWWLARKERRFEWEEADLGEPWVLRGECICGREVAGGDLHLVVAIPADDDRLGIEGDTAMSADFCADHCPGGCDKACLPAQ